MKIFCRNVSVSQCRKISQVNPSVLSFRISSVVKKLMDERGGIMKIFCRKFFVSQCGKNSVGGGIL